MARELTTFSFPPTLKNKLLKGGFRYVSDLKGVKTVALAKGPYSTFSFSINTHCITELEISHDEAYQILKTVKLEDEDEYTSGGNIAGMRSVAFIRSEM